MTQNGGTVFCCLCPVLLMIDVQTCPFHYEDDRRVNVYNVFGTRRRRSILRNVMNIAKLSYRLHLARIVWKSIIYIHTAQPPCIEN